MSVRTITNITAIENGSALSIDGLSQSSYTTYSFEVGKDCKRIEYNENCYRDHSIPYYEVHIGDDVETIVRIYERGVSSIVTENK